MAERALFSYEALDRAGNKVSGSLEAVSDGEAARLLAQQGLTPYALKRARGAFPKSTSRATPFSLRPIPADPIA